MTPTRRDRALVFVFVILHAVGVLATTACRKANATGPSAVVTGSWSGAIVDTAAGTGSISLQMSQTASGISGTWSATFASGTSVSGTLSGSLTATGVSLFLAPLSPIACPAGATLSGTLSVTATLSGNRLTGSYVVFTCSGTTTGTIDVTR